MSSQEIKESESGLSRQGGGQDGQDQQEGGQGVPKEGRG